MLLLWLAYNGPWRKEPILQGTPPSGILLCQFFGTRIEFRCANPNFSSFPSFWQMITCQVSTTFGVAPFEVDLVAFSRPCQVLMPSKTSHSSPLLFKFSWIGTDSLFLDMQEPNFFYKMPID